jgi:hypothetical protein
MANRFFQFQRTEEDDEILGLKIEMNEEGHIHDKKQKKIQRQASQGKTITREDIHKTRQDKKRESQDKTFTRQDKTRHDKTRQDKT